MQHVIKRIDDNDEICVNCDAWGEPGAINREEPCPGDAVNN